MTCRRVLCALAICAIVALPVAAQSGGPLSMLRMVFVLQQQVDQLQRRQDGTGELYMRLNLEAAYVSSPGVLVVSGWAFACEDPDARVVVVIDGIQSVQSGAGFVTRHLRSDVNAAYVGFCGLMPMHVGAMALVDIGAFEPGWLGNHQHTVRLRLFNAAGKMAESNIINVTTQ